MKTQHVVTLLVVFVVAILIGSCLSREVNQLRDSKATVRVSGNESSLDVSLYPGAFYDGGSDNQVYLFRKYEGSEEWHLDVVVNNGWSLEGGVVESQFLLVCAPKGMMEEEILQFMWMRYHSQDWHVTWKGTKAPGKVEVWCE